MVSPEIASGVRTASTSAPARSSVATMRRSCSRSDEMARTRRFDKIPLARTALAEPWRSYQGLRRQGEPPHPIIGETPSENGGLGHRHGQQTAAAGVAIGQPAHSNRLGDTMDSGAGNASM